MQYIRLIVTASLIAFACGRVCGGENLVRNGSFEGSLLYWHNTDAEHRRLVRGPAAAGAYSLRIEKGWVMSAPIACRPGGAFTVSFFVRGDREGEVHVQMPPSAREVGQRAKRLWCREARQSAKIGTAWKRVSFTAKADVPQTGFWPHPHYMIMIEGSVPLHVDGVTVRLGEAGTQQYVPRRAVEVLSDCPDLPGYEGHGNLLARGATVRLTAHAHNPGARPRDVTLRWQLVDYEGVRPVSEAVERRVTIPPDKALSPTVPMKLTATGCVLARVTAAIDGKEVDRSDLPITSLAYAFGPRKPDGRERFGGSFFGPPSARLGSRLGLAWSRWFPHTKWQDHQPAGPDAFHWFDKELDELEGLGISTHLVLYGWPKWAMDKTHPLPKDMRWPADDPRWDDLFVRTAWDRYIDAAVAHYQGRAVIFEIENEPELDRWEKYRDEYARFTIRTARRIKRADPNARVMVNNVYGIPSGLNRHLLERGGAKWIDIISWHDYHEGWLADASAMKRMRARLDALGGRHIEIWFNEGWAFTNTAVDEPIACTRLTAAESTNAMVCSIAELTAAGQDKTILFHTGYAKHGMSFWDYSGPGTMLWDWYSYPLPLAAAWNVLAHHVGLSERVALVRPEGANFCIFQDLRNGRGVMVAYADRASKADVTVELPMGGLIAEDAMGNAAPLAGRTLTLSRTGRPVFLYDAAGTAGKAFAARLAPLDRKHASFVSRGGASYRLPPTWEGTVKGSPEGNPARAGGTAVWRLDQVWPPEPNDPAHYRPLVWRDGWWVPRTDSFGDQPKAERKDRGVRLEFRARHGTPKAERICGLVFLAPKAGRVTFAGSARMRLWDGRNPVRLTLLHKTPKGAAEMAALKLVAGKAVPLAGFAAKVAAGDELVLLPRIDGMFTGGDVVLLDVCAHYGSAGAATWRLPRAWEGEEAGAARGNPIRVGGTAVWRLDQLWPDDPMMAAHYYPMVWDGSRWGVREHGQGGQPGVTVADGAFRAGVRGPWNGADLKHQKTAALVFLVPESGVYRIAGVARTKPWEGGAKTFRLGLFKKDTQRAAKLKELSLPRDASPVPFELTVELTAGHELLFLPLMPDWHNATTTSIEDLTITRTRSAKTGP